MKLELSKEWFEKNIERDGCCDIEAGCSNHTSNTFPVVKVRDQQTQLAVYKSLRDVMDALKSRRQAYGLTMSELAIGSHLSEHAIRSLEDVAQASDDLVAYASVLNANITMHIKTNEDVNVVQAYPHLSRSHSWDDINRIRLSVKQNGLLRVGEEVEVMA